jgi:mRNA interferase RelE/StbE
VKRYRVVFLPSARRQAKKLPQDVRDTLRPYIRALSRDPRPPGVLKMEGEENLYRIRVGDYRIIYRIEEDVLLVLVVAIGDRKDVYR